MDQQQASYRRSIPLAAAASSPGSASRGAGRGWFRDHYDRLFGERDAVEAQLRDIARQGAFGARISHLFAALLIILFSTASLIALGADSMRAVLASLAHGTVDIPNAVATGVTALLVPAMDVAMLRAASKIRLLATRRATRREMGLHIAVMIVISLIEAGTYCYMAAIYEHPVGVVAWTLIAARALAAPLIGVYLAMDRPHPVTSRDILAQVELGAGAGVIRDVTEIANDPDASLQRKMELFGASAVMREDEQRRLADLIAVAGKHNPTLPEPRARIVAAGYASPPSVPPQEHVTDATDAYRAMHDGWDDDDMLDETEDDSDLFSTLTIPAVRLDGGAPSGPATDETSHGAGSRKTSGGRGRNRAASNASKKGNSKVKSEAKALRRAAIRDTVYAILDEWHAAGRPAGLSDRELARRVAARVSFAVNPSGNTVARWRGPWQSSRAHKAALEAEGAAEGAIVSDETIAELESLEPALP